MTDKVNPWMVFPTPVPGLPSVTLYRDQWDNHITAKHVEMVGQENRVGLVISTPTIVINSPDTSGYYIFVNEDVRSPHGTTPMAVCVDPADQFVVTAYYERAFRVSVSGTVIWQR